VSFQRWPSRERENPGRNNRQHSKLSEHRLRGGESNKFGIMIEIKRAYEPVKAGSSHRFLVDQLWPRGVKKEALQLGGWVRAVAPSKKLRSWFGHDPAKWKEFQRRYATELDAKPETLQPLLNAARKGDITLVFGARDVEHNNAVVLRDYLMGKLPKKRK